MQDVSRSDDRGRRGFSLVVVVLLTGVLAASALVVFARLEQDARLHGHERRVRELREATVGGLGELLNDARVQGLLPTKPGTPGAFDYGRPAASVFFGDSPSATSYSAEVTLVRTAPVLESSQRRVRAVLYEVRVRGSAPSQHTADLEAIIYRIGAAPPAGVGTEVYGR